MLLVSLAMMRCLPPNVAKPRIIRRSCHHWALPNIICRQANIILLTASRSEVRSANKVAFVYAVYGTNLNTFSAAGTQ